MRSINPKLVVALFIALISLALFAPVATAEQLSLTSPASSFRGDPDLSNPTVRYRQYVTINRGAIDALVGSEPSDVNESTVVIKLGVFPQTSLVPQKRRVVSKSGTGVSGILQGVKRGTFSLVVHKSGLVSGSFMADGQLFRLVSAGGQADQTHVIQEIETRFYAPEAEPLVPLVNEREQPRSDARGAQTSADAGDVLDVMVLYTPAAKVQAGSQAAIEALIDLAIIETDKGYSDSGVNMQLNLVYKSEVNYTEDASFSVDLSRLTSKTDGFIDEIHTLRDTYGADVVVLLRESGQYCGIAYLMQNLSASFESSAFSVTSQSCATGYYSFGHELGHNLGSAHDRPNATTGVLSYSFGHVESNSGAWRTIMAYGNTCASCPRINRWSNAELNYQGQPTGVDSTASNSADNELSLNDVRATATNWRQSVGAGLPQLTGPLPGDLLGETETFSWSSNGTTVAEWWLYVGSSLGAKDYFDSGNLFTATTQGVSNLPADGSEVFVRLYYRSNSTSTWSWVDSTYFAFTGPPQLCSVGTPNFAYEENWGSGGTSDWTPTNLVGSNTWSTATNNPDPATGSSVHLFVPNVGAVSDTVLAMNNAVTVPPNGLLHIRHWRSFEPFWDGGVLEWSNDGGQTWSRFTLAEFVSGGYDGALGTGFSNPLSGEQAFTGSSSYQSSFVDLSSKAGDSLQIRFRVGTDSYQSNNYGWDIDDVQIYSCGDAIPQITAPTPDTTLAGSTDSFEWTDNGNNVTQWWLYVGSTLGGKQHHDSGDLGASPSQPYSVTTLPTDGSDVYVRLFFRTPGNATWNFVDVQYTADGSGGGAPGAATLVSPNGNGASSAPTYVWNVVPGATYYRLWVESPVGTPVIQQWFTSAGANCDASTCNVTPSTNVSTASRWWIQTWSAIGSGPWSSAMNFAP